MAIVDFELKWLIYTMLVLVVVPVEAKSYMARLAKLLLAMTWVLVTISYAIEIVYSLQ